MKLVKLGSLALLTSLALASTSGCLVRAHGRIGGPVIYVEEEPPPPRVWITDTRPGYIFIQGRWDRNGGQWVWRDGYWDRQRSGYYYEDGRWDRRGNRHVWVEGNWRSGNRVQPARTNNGNGNVRDHRDNRPAEPARGNGNVRDHRR